MILFFYFIRLNDMCDIKRLNFHDFFEFRQIPRNLIFHPYFLEYYMQQPLKTKHGNNMLSGMKFLGITLLGIQAFCEKQPLNTKHDSNMLQHEPNGFLGMVGMLIGAQALVITSNYNYFSTNLPVIKNYESYEIQIWNLC